MSEEAIVLPHHLQIFLGAIKSVRARLYSGLEQNVYPVVETPDFLQCVAGLLQPLELFSRGMDRIINRQLGAAVQRSDASEVEILSAVGALELELNRAMSAYQTIRAFNVHGENVYPRQLLEDSYSHLFNQLCAWLDEVVEILSDPAGTLKKRGLPTSGSVNVTANLSLTPAPQLEKLIAWCNARNEELAVTEAGKSVPPAPKGTDWLAILGWMWWFRK